MRLAYFLRPEFGARFWVPDEGGNREGEEWKSVDWHDRKYKAFRAKEEVQERSESQVLTGKKGFLGEWSGGR